MSILMDALKQQVEPASVAASPQANNGWRNVALLLGFCLALVLGFALAYWWQYATSPQISTAPMVSEQLNAEPRLADSAGIAAVLNSAEAEPAAGQSKPDTVQEQLAPEPKVISVTAPAPELANQQAVTQPVETSLPEVEVSDELRQRFASAMAATDIDRRQAQPAMRGAGAPARDISELAPALQQQIPPLRFEAHVYATQSQQRWIKVNGKSLQEGQWVTADIRLKEITPHFVLLEMGNELFSLAALSDYK